MVSEQGFVHRQQRRHAAACAAHQAGRFGQQLGEIEARGVQLGGVEAVAAVLFGQRDLGTARKEVGEHQVGTNYRLSINLRFDRW